MGLNRVPEPMGLNRVPEPTGLNRVPEPMCRGLYPCFYPALPVPSSSRTCYVVRCSVDAGTFPGGYAGRFPYS